MITVGIDSAETTGIGILSGSRLVKNAVVPVADWGAVERIAERLATYEPDLVAIEAPFVRLNAATGLSLARLQGRWLQAFERRGIATTSVLASTWQPIVLAGRMTSRTPGPDRKLAAVAWVRETFGVELPADAADAVGIAAWASGVFGRPGGPPAAPRANRAATGPQTGQFWPVSGGQP